MRNSRGGHDSCRRGDPTSDDLVFAGLGANASTEKEGRLSERNSMPTSRSVKDRNEATEVSGESITQLRHKPTLPILRFF